MTGGTHQARVSRRFRHGGYQAYATCPCGWEYPAGDERTAARLVGQHNRTPEVRAEEAEAS